MFSLDIVCKPNVNDLVHLLFRELISLVQRLTNVILPTWLRRFLRQIWISKNSRVASNSLN